MKKHFFTLIEIVVVCAIILFLTAGLFALGLNLSKKYYLMQGKMEMLKIQNAITAYKSATGYFPPDYISSSHNEDGSNAKTPCWKLVFIENVSPSTNKQLVEDLYKETGDRPKALSYGMWNGHPMYAVFIWDWQDDWGGIVKEASTPDKPYGFVCQPPKCGSELCSRGDFYATLSVPFRDKTGSFPINDSSLMDVTEVFKCKYGAKGSQTRKFQCNDDPNDNGFSCGWHSFIGESWEAYNNSSETAKALYDYLARPMKGRMKDGKPSNPKYENSKPFIELSNKLVRPANRPPPINCKNEPLRDTPANYRLYGDGIYATNDSYEIVDVWGNAYIYISSAPEYVVPNFGDTLKPYQSLSAQESALANADSIDLDLRPPFYNPGSYDIGSKGPDGMAVNWVPFDFKLYSPSGYKDALGDPSNISADVDPFVFSDDQSMQRKNIFGQGEDQFFKLPSEQLKLIDFDNDNLTNFFEN